MDTNVNNLSVAELRAQREALDKALKEKTSVGREDAIKQIVKVMADFDISTRDLSKVIGKVEKAEPTKKAAPKYRNPANAEETWTGRGKAPLWIKDVPADQRSAYLIPAAAPVAAETAQPAPEDAPVGGMFNNVA